MVRGIWISFLIIGLGITANSQDTLHVLTYGNSYENTGEDVMFTSDSNYVVVGSTFTNDTMKSDMYILKLDYNFEKLWSISFGSIHVEGAKSVIETEEGNYVVVGHSNALIDQGYDIYVLCLDKDGNYLWDRFYGGLDWEFANDAQLRYDGTIVICGQTYSYGNGGGDAYVLNIDADGNLLDESFYGGTGEDVFNELIETSDSSLVFIGETYDDMDSMNIYGLKLNKNDEIMVETSLGGPREDKAFGLSEAQNGDILVSGVSNSQYSVRKDLDAYCTRLDNELNELWEGYAFGNSGVGDTDTCGCNFDDAVNDNVEWSNGFILSVGYTETFGNIGKNMAIFHWSPTLDWVPEGPASSYLYPEKDENLRRIILNGSRYVAIGTTEGEGEGNQDIILLWGDTLYNGMSYYSTNYADTFTNIVGIGQANGNVDVTIFPNPAKEKLSVSGLNSQYQNMTVYGLKGEILIRKTLDTMDQVQIEVSGFSQGVYILELVSGKDRIVQKFQVTH